jgi:hypothetical protein
LSDKKITQLNNITGANLVDADEFVVVDISADETKAITLGELKEAFDAGSGFVRVTGDTMTGDLSFGDNDKAIFGAGSDLQIYHDGANSYVKDAGTGNLILAGNNVQVMNSDASQNYITGTNGAGVSLHYNGPQKLATTSTGVDVTGTITSDGLTVGDTSFASNAIIKTQVEGSDVGDFDSGLQMRSHNNDFGGTIALESRSGVNDVVAFKYHSNSANGVRAMSIDATNGDISFYEDTGTTAKFFWDASAESLGIGTSSPSGILQVQASNPDFYITSADTGQSDIYFGGTTSPTKGRIQYSDNSDSMMLWTNSTERLRIDSSGNLLVGRTSNNWPTAAGFTAQSNGAIIASRADASGYFNRLSTDGSIVNFSKDGSTVGSIGSQGGATLSIAGAVGSGIYFGSTGVLPANGSGSLVDATRDIGSASWRNKALYLSGGVYLGGTGSANLLDDYEEGTWTAEIYDAATGGNASATTDTGLYTKVGRMVTATVNFSNIDTTGMTVSEPVNFTLPFTNGVSRSLGSVRLYANVDGATVSLAVFVNSSATRATIQESRDNNTIANVSVANLISGSSDLSFTITYQV